MSPEWSAEDIRKRLELGASGSGRACANIFFLDTVSRDQLSSAAGIAIKEAAKRLGRPASHVTVGRVYPLAKSVSVEGDPQMIAELLKAETVKTILPSQIDDIYPKPIGKRIVE